MFVTLDSLLEALREADPDPKVYHQLLSRIAFGKEELAPYLHFRENFYTRNLIEKNRHFEIMTLCWQAGHYTPVHDHQGSDGWLYVVEGRVLEKIFHYDTDKPEGEILSLSAEVTSVAQDLSHINDDMGFHSIHNIGESQAVTIHFYSPAIEKCLYVCPNSYETKVRVLSYFSEQGQISET